MSNITALATDIANVVLDAMAQKERQGTILRGTVAGTQIIVDGHYYPYSLAVDVTVNDGDSVLVQILSDVHQAVIVGV